MSQVDITFKNGTEAHYLAVGSPDDVFATLPREGVARVEVHSADDLTWPTADECPVNA